MFCAFQEGRIKSRWQMGEVSQLWTWYYSWMPEWPSSQVSLYKFAPLFSSKGPFAWTARERRRFQIKSQGVRPYTWTLPRFSQAVLPATTKDHGSSPLLHLPNVEICCCDYGKHSLQRPVCRGVQLPSSVFYPDPWQKKNTCIITKYYLKKAHNFKILLVLILTLKSIKIEKQ